MVRSAGRKARKEPKVSKTLSASMEDEENARILTGDEEMARPPPDVVEFLNGPTSPQDERYRVDALRSAVVSEGALVAGYAQWRNTELKSRVASLWSS